MVLVPDKSWAFDVRILPEKAVVGLTGPAVTDDRGRPWLRGTVGSPVGGAFVTVAWSEGPAGERRYCSRLYTPAGQLLVSVAGNKVTVHDEERLLATVILALDEGWKLTPGERGILADALREVLKERRKE